MHRRKLLSLRCVGGLTKFHTEYTAAAAAAMPIMGEEWVKEQYLDQVQPRDLAPFLRARSSEPLQVLMAAALDLEADLKSARTAARPTHITTTTTPSGGRGSNGGMVQNPNRKPCEKCRRWKFMWDACTNCGQAGTGKRPADHRSNSAPRRRVSELAIAEEGDFHAHEDDV